MKDKPTYVRPIKVLTRIAPRVLSRGGTWTRTGGSGVEYVAAVIV